MGSISNYLELELLDHVFKVGAYTAATNIAVSLHTADPTDAGTGAECANANNYARVVCNVWNAAGGTRVTANTSAITFPQASGSWGTVTHWALWDSATYGAGNCLAHGSFTASKVIVSGNIPTIAAGDLDITVTTGAISNYLASALLNHFLKTAAYTVPTNICAALSTADPTDDGSGIAEPVGNNYSRTTNNTWDIAAAGATANTGAMTTATASGSWGTIAYTALFDAATVGNMLWYGTISPSQAVGANDYMEWAAGSFDVTLD